MPELVQGLGVQQAIFRTQELPAAAQGQQHRQWQLKQALKPTFTLRRVPMARYQGPSRNGHQSHGGETIDEGGYQLRCWRRQNPQLP